jgi:hypothetical protein
MNRIVFGIAGTFLLLATNAEAQNVSNRVTGTVGGVGSVAGGAGSAASAAGSPTASITNPGNGTLPGSATGGNLPGALGFKAGNRVIEFRGAAGVGDDRGNVKAVLGIPF